MDNIWVTGGAWISANGYGRMSEGGKPLFSAGKPVIPAAREVFSRPLQRYGRFDTYTKLGCASVALCLKDAALARGEKDNIGIVVSTLYEVMETDLAYYKTTLEQDGTLSSPNLFSYTLPVIALGECAVIFNLTGPTFCVGEEKGRGINALKNALDMISSGKADKMIAGWIDSPPEENSGTDKAGAISGAIFIILETNTCVTPLSQKKISYNNNRITLNDKEISSIPDLFW